jgi:hypothetical protein
VLLCPTMPSGDSPCLSQSIFVVTLPQLAAPYIHITFLRSACSCGCTLRHVPLITDTANTSVPAPLSLVTASLDQYSQTVVKRANDTCRGAPLTLFQVGFTDALVHHG